MGNTGQPYQRQWSTRTRVLIVLAACLAAAHLACRRAAEVDRPPVRIAFADFVNFQQRNVTTDAISTSDGLGLELLGEGWKLADGSDKDTPLLQMIDRRAAMSCFSAGGDLKEIKMKCNVILPPGSPEAAH